MMSFYFTNACLSGTMFLWILVSYPAQKCRVSYIPECHQAWHSWAWILLFYFSAHSQMQSEDTSKAMYFLSFFLFFSNYKKTAEGGCVKPRFSFFFFSTLSPVHAPLFLSSVQDIRNHTHTHTHTHTHVSFFFLPSLGEISHGQSVSPFQPLALISDSFLCWRYHPSIRYPSYAFVFCTPPTPLGINSFCFFPLGSNYGHAFLFFIFKQRASLTFFSLFLLPTLSNLFSPPSSTVLRCFLFSISSFFLPPFTHPSLLPHPN